MKKILDKKKNLIAGLLFGVLLVVGLIIRAPMFLAGDIYLLPDQGRDLQLVKQIAVDHKLTLIGGHAGIGGLFHGPMWFYLITPFFIAFHGHPLYTLVSVYLFVSVALIVGGFFVVSRLYGIWSGILFAFLFVFSQEFVQTVSFTSNAQVMPLIFLGYLFFLIKSIRENAKYFALVLFFVGLGFQFESAFAVFLIPMTLLTLLVFRLLPSRKQWIIGLLLFILPLTSFLLFDLRHDFLMTQSAVKLLKGDVSVSQEDQQYKQLSVRVADRVHVLLSLFPNSLPTNANGPLVLIVVFFLSTLGLLIRQQVMKKHWTQEEKEFVFLGGFLVVILFLYLFYKQSLQLHYIQSLHIIVLLLIVLAMKQVANYKVGKIAVAVFLLLLLLPTISLTQESLQSAKNFTTNSAGSFKNQLEAANWVYHDANGQPFGYFVYDIPGVTYSMDYMMWWLGKTRYQYLPQSNKEPVTYLILFPSKEGDLGAHDFWVKYTVRTEGKVLERKIFASGLEVRKLRVSPNEQPANPNYFQNLIFR